MYENKTQYALKKNNFSVEKSEEIPHNMFRVCDLSNG